MLDLFRIQLVELTLSDDYEGGRDAMKINKMIFWMPNAAVMEMQTVLGQ